MQRSEVSGAIRPIYGSLSVKGLIHQQLIDMQNLLPPKRNFTNSSTLTYTSATTHMKINIFIKLKVHFIPTMVTRQKTIAPTTHHKYENLHYRYFIRLYRTRRPMW